MTAPKDARGEAREFWIRWQPHWRGHSITNVSDKERMGDDDFHVIEYSALTSEREKVAKLRAALVKASKRSTYLWSNGPSYSPNDWANEAQIVLASKLLAEIDAEGSGE